MYTWSSIRDQLERYKERHGAHILTEFADWLALPNDAEDISALEKNASHLEAMLRVRGIHAETWRLQGASPVVFGEWHVPGAVQTLLLYAHFDGQPADPEDWATPPWEPALFSNARELGGRQIPFPETGSRIDPAWRVYARSAGDDKAPFIAVLAAIDFLQDRGFSPAANIKFIFESEEEKGSPSLEKYLRLYKDRLKADLTLICDGPVHPSGRPQLYFGARGFTGFTMTVYGPLRHLHSGHYGNWAPNPALMLAQLLATFKSESGKVLVRGFYDTVEPLNDAARDALETVPAMDDQLRYELALARSDCDNAPLNEQVMLPSLNIRGLKSGVADGRIVNMIPATASASLDIRLVKGNTPEDMLDRVERHIERQGYLIVRDEPDAGLRREYPRIARIVPDPGYGSVRTDMTIPIVSRLIDVVRQSIDEQVVLLPTLGGSLPLYHFAEHVDAPIVGVPIANHDNNQHGPNENLCVANLWYGIDLFTAILLEAG